MEKINLPRVLMIVQKMDEEDSVFAFVPGWVREFRKHLERLYVLALCRGKFKDLGDVDVFSLGKEKGGNKLSYIFNLYRVVLPLVRKGEIDGIFVFQGGVYPLLLWPLKKIFKFKLIQWKVHSVVNLKMKLNVKVVDEVITATNTCFRDHLPKVKVLSHGIDTDQFRLLGSGLRRDVIVVVGRITPIKALDRIIDVFADFISQAEFKHAKLEFYGVPQNNRDQKYLDHLKRQIRERNILDNVEFKGKAPFGQLPAIYSDCRLSLNIGNVGSLDKVILESMACETPVIMVTPAIKDQLGAYEPLLHVPAEEEFLENIKEIFRMQESEYKKMGKALRGTVVQFHSLEKLMERISCEFKVY